MQKEIVMVIFNSSIEEEMLGALKEAGMECFTKLPGVHGTGQYSEPRLDSHVWPGTNTLMMVCAEPETRARILQAVRQMKEIHQEEGVRAFVIPVTDTI
jgi:nitrogen regulatory protein PII